MILRRPATHGKAKASSGNEGARRRARRYVALIFGAGIASGAAALAGIPPFGSLQGLLSPIAQFLHPQPASVPIQASTIFPPVPPVHQVVDVYDPPPPAQKSNPGPQPPATTPTPHPKASPTPPLQSSPSPTPRGDD
jgi:hypothetical protein